ncbi:MAG: hypothetical protein R6U32_04635 [Candidatus Woesearchaeota archaeon]
MAKKMAQNKNEKAEDSEKDGLIKKVRVTDGQRSSLSNVIVSMADDVYGLELNGRVKKSLHDIGMVMIDGTLYFSGYRGHEDPDAQEELLEVESFNGSLFDGKAPERIKVGDMILYSDKEAAIQEAAKITEGPAEESNLESMAGTDEGIYDTNTPDKDFLIAALYARALQTAEEKEELSGRLEEKAKEYEREMESKEDEHQKELAAQKDILEGKHGKKERELKRQVQDYEKKLAEYEGRENGYEEKLEEQRKYTQYLDEELNKARKLIENYDALVSEIAEMSREKPLRERVAAARNKLVELRGLRERVKELEEEMSSVEELYISPDAEVPAEDGATPLQKPLQKNTESTKENDASYNTAGSPRDLDAAANYVVLKIYNRYRGDEDAVMKELNEVLDGFERLEPEDKGLTRKDFAILREFYNHKCQEMSQYTLMDHSIITPLIVDNEIKPMFRSMETPSERVSLEHKLRGSYENYETEQ